MIGDIGLTLVVIGEVVLMGASYQNSRLQRGIDEPEL
jgi:hypothetical protein